MKRLVWICLAIAFSTTLLMRAFSEPVSRNLLRQLQRGMTKAQVRQILGEPSAVHFSGQWTYQRPLVFGFVNIHWQADGTYDGEYNYERF